MFQRVLVILTFASSLALPVAAVTWGRSYVAHDLGYWIEDGHGVVASAARGELSVWWGVTATGTEPRRGVEARDLSRTWRTRDRFQRRPPAYQAWVGDFGYARNARFPNRLAFGASQDSVQCVAIPLWFLALISSVLPARLLWLHMSEEGRRWRERDGLCVHCGYPVNAALLACAECGTSTARSCAGTDPVAAPVPLPRTRLILPRALTRPA